MLNLVTLLLLLAIYANGENDIYSSRALDDEIKNLPGLPKGVDFRQFSGTFLRFRALETLKRKRII